MIKLSVLALAAAGSFGIQWIFFLPSAYFKTEKFYDCIGSLTFITVNSAALALTGQYKSRAACIQYGCIMLWAARLGSFLVYRIMRDGSDRRFYKIKTSNSLLFVTWNVQGLWVFMSSLPTLYWLAKIPKVPVITPLHMIGWSMFLTGFAIEATADHQKLMFKENQANEKKTIQHGLWSLSRHPNYAGEILLWWGLFISAASNFTSWRSVAICSSGPLFVTYLLGKFSLDMLERSSNYKYGKDESYIDYRRRTKKLIPFIY